MAASIKICDKTSGKLARYLLPDVQLDGSIAQLKSLITQKNDYESSKFNIIFCGKRLEEDSVVKSSGIKDGVTLYILPVQQQKTPVVGKEPSVSEVVSALQPAIAHPGFKAVHDKVMQSAKTLDELVSQVPGLAKDPIAATILQEVELVGMLHDYQYVKKVMAAHPCIGRAAILLASIIMREIKESGASGRGGTARGNFSLDQMSDDEDMPGPARQPIVNQPITNDQLANALAAAMGVPVHTPPAQQAGSGQTPRSAASASASPAQLGDLFRQTLQQMNSPAGASASPVQPPATSTAVTQANLQALRDMGITDEARARQALEATNGNIQAAVAFLFGEGN